jgi:membrane associated rhomboid family serine protease
MSFGPPQTPEIIKNLMIANGVVFIAQILMPSVGFDVTRFGVVQPAAVWQEFQLWRVFTYMWLHSPTSFLHIAFNMFALWMFGSSLALLWGEKRFLRYYLTCGVGAGFLIASIPVFLGWFGMTNAREYFGQTLGASGAVMGVLLAYSFTWPDRTIMLLFPPIPIKAIYLIPLLFVMEWLSSGAGSNVSHIGHLAGVLVGWIYLVNEGRTPGAPTPQSLLLKWRRYRMRQKIRSVHRDDRRGWGSNDDDDQPGRFH